MAHAQLWVVALVVLSAARCAAGNGVDVKHTGVVEVIGHAEGVAHFLHLPGAMLPMRLSPGRASLGKLLTGQTITVTGTPAHDELAAPASLGASRAAGGPLRAEVESAMLMPGRQLAGAASPDRNQPARLTTLVVDELHVEGSRSSSSRGGSRHLAQEIELRPQRALGPLSALVVRVSVCDETPPYSIEDIRASLFPDPGQPPPLGFDKLEQGASNLDQSDTYTLKETYERCSYGKASMSTQGVVLLNTTVSICDEAVWAAAKEACTGPGLSADLLSGGALLRSMVYERLATIGVDPLAYDRSVMHLPTVPSCTWVSFGTIGCVQGGPCSVWVIAPPIRATLSELAVNFGGGPAIAQLYSVAESPVGSQPAGTDYTCARGRKAAFTCLNAPNSWRVGWSLPMVTLGAENLTLGVPLQFSIPAQITSERSFVLISIPGQPNLFLSYRRPDGKFDQVQPAVYLHSSSPACAAGVLSSNILQCTTTLLAQLASQGLWLDSATQLRVAVLSIGPDAAQVQVCRSATACPGERTLHLTAMSDPFSSPGYWFLNGGSAVGFWDDTAWFATSGFITQIAMHSVTDPQPRIDGLQVSYSSGEAPARGFVSPGEAGTGWQSLTLALGEVVTSMTVHANSQGQPVQITFRTNLGRSTTLGSCPANCTVWTVQPPPYARRDGFLAALMGSQSRDPGFVQGSSDWSHLSQVQFVWASTGNDPCACIFPFVYRGRTYTQCTSVDNDSPWCMTSPMCTPVTLAAGATPAGLRQRLCDTPPPPPPPPPRSLRSPLVSPLPLGSPLVLGSPPRPLSPGSLSETPPPGPSGSPALQPPSLQPPALQPPVLQPPALQPPENIRVDAPPAWAGGGSPTLPAGAGSDSPPPSPGQGSFGSPGQGSFGSPGQGIFGSPGQGSFGSPGQGSFGSPVAASSNAGQGGPSIAAVVGGSVGGAAALLLVSVLALFWWPRLRGCVGRKQMGVEEWPVAGKTDELAGAAEVQVELQSSDQSEQAATDSGRRAGQGEGSDAEAAVVRISSEVSRPLAGHGSLDMHAAAVAGYAVPSAPSRAGLSPRASAASAAAAAAVVLPPGGANIASSVSFGPVGAQIGQCILVAEDILASALGASVSPSRCQQLASGVAGLLPALNRLRQLPDHVLEQRLTGFMPSLRAIYATLASCEQAVSACSAAAQLQPTTLPELVALMGSPQHDAMFQRLGAELRHAAAHLAAMQDKAYPAMPLLSSSGRTGSATAATNGEAGPPASLHTLQLEGGAQVDAYVGHRLNGSASGPADVSLQAEQQGQEQIMAGARRDVQDLVRHAVAQGGFESWSSELAEQLARLCARHGLDLEQLMVQCGMETVAKRNARATAMAMRLEDLKYISLHDIHGPAGPNTALQLIGSGGAGTVYRGVWQGEEVVVKRMESVTQACMQEEVAREVYIMSSCHHPNIAQIYGLARDADRGVVCIVMRYYSLGSLAAVLHGAFEGQRFEGQGTNLALRLTLGHKLRMALDIARGMAYLHSRPNELVVHGDLKPGNVLVDENLRCYVSDFGTASMHTDTRTLAPCSNAQSLSYSAPELLEALQGVCSQGAEAEAGANRVKRTIDMDVYAFGMTLYELFTGEVPFAGIGAHHVAWLVTSGKRPAIPPWTTVAAANPPHPGNLGYGEPHPGITGYGVPTPVACIIDRCWQQQPFMRPTFTQLVPALEAAGVALQLELD